VTAVVVASARDRIQRSSTWVAGALSVLGSQPSSRA